MNNKKNMFDGQQDKITEALKNFHEYLNTTTVPVGVMPVIPSPKGSKKTIYNGPIHRNPNMRCFICKQKLKEEKYGSYEISFTKLKNDKLDDKGMVRSLFYCHKCFEDVAGKDLIDSLMNQGDKFNW